MLSYNLSIEPAGVVNLMVSDTPSRLVSWSAPSNGTDGCQANGYEVKVKFVSRCSKSSEKWLTPSRVDGTSYALPNLLSYHIYNVYVTPVNAAGKGKTGDVYFTTNETGMRNAMINLIKSDLILSPNTNTSLKNNTVSNPYMYIHNK